MAMYRIIDEAGHEVEIAIGATRTASEIELAAALKSVLMEVEGLWEIASNLAKRVGEKSQWGRANQNADVRAAREVLAKYAEPGDPVADNQIAAQAIGSVSIEEALGSVSGIEDRALAALLAYCYASEADDATCKRAARALAEAYGVATEGADDKRRLQIAWGLRMLASSLGIPSPRRVLGHVSRQDSAWSKAFETTPEDVRRAADEASSDL